jgi:multiple antibiotic resistance protein
MGAALLANFLVCFPAIFLVVDPLGVVPVFLAMTSRDPPAKARAMALRACLVACSLLLFFAVFGTWVFGLFGISLASFRVAGGLLLLLTALDMLRARTSETRTTSVETQDGMVKDDVALVPLAIPLLAGPGAIATVMLLMARGPGPAYAVPVLVAVLSTFIISYLILRSSAWVQRVLRQSGVAVLERVMGLILAGLAIQFVADGIRDLVRGV